MGPRTAHPSVCDRYRPTVEQFLRHVDELRESTRWDDSVGQDRIERVPAVDGGFTSTGTATSGMC